ncbi:hypothetical protein TNCV_722981 [Trichonephila clavipes]|nr:hypothetical protein TNCV_722981 [Trichonephila clavipes]
MPPISIALFDLTFQIRSVAFNAKDLVIRKQSAAASQPALDVQSKTYVSTAIQVDASTAPKSAQSDSVKPKPIAVDTRPSVSTPLTVKKTRKARIKESGVQSQKKKRSNLSKNSMTWETMSWKFMPHKATKV